MKAKGQKPRVKIRFFGLFISFKGSKWHQFWILTILTPLIVNLGSFSPEQSIKAQEVNKAQLPIVSGRGQLERLQLASYYYWQGQYQDAIAVWETLLESSTPSTSAQIHRYLGVAYRNIGQTSRAFHHFKQAWQLAQNHPSTTSKRQLAEIFISMGQTLNELGQGKRSLGRLTEALSMIENHNLLELQTTAYRELGTAYLITEDFDQAIKTYIRSRDLAAVHQQGPEEVAALNNLTNALMKRQRSYQREAIAAATSGNIAEQERLLFLAQKDHELALSNASKAVIKSQKWQNLSTVTAMIQLTQLDSPSDYRADIKNILLTQPPSRAKAQLLLTLAQLESRAVAESAPPAHAVKTLELAVEIATKLGDFRTQSLAMGQLGHVYELSGHYEQALLLTQQAQWAAQQVMAADSLYRWQWQAGRIYHVTNRPQQAKAAYRGAITTLETLREEISHGSRELQIDVREEIEPVYREFLALLLDGKPQPTELREALAVNNQLQLTELQSFFGDPCLEIRQAQLKAHASLPAHTARIHSLILSNSTQIILELPSGAIYAYPMAFKAEQMQKTIEQWRIQLESSRIPLGYRDLSERLYDWLIRPMEKELAAAQIKTVIFVNDGLLRNVPMAALHDGERFLIEKYALSYSLGINVSFSEPTIRDYRAIAFGLSVPVADFPPLPYADPETQQVINTLGGERFLNEAFTVSNLLKQVRNNNRVIHLATHGEFGGTAKTTFLQTFDRPIFLDEFEQILSQSTEPIDLLTLSACQTAVGNKRAVLGLAGVALRSGVKSVLATLWSVKDDNVVSIISRFYQYWQQGLEKEEAYQKTLVEFVNQPQSHPQNWSAFVLITN